MNKNFELTLELKLQKCSNLIKSARNIEEKLEALQKELEKYQTSLSSLERDIAQFGLKGSKTPEAEKYNEALQREKEEYISKNHPEIPQRTSSGLASNYLEAILLAKPKN